jgi:nitrite reductase/ring-hydroxylating ferredoxin subunit
VVVEGRIVALYNVDGDVYALDGVCPHQGGPLGKGRLEGTVVTCPWHGWQFDVRDGQHQINPAMRQPLFPVRVEGDEILVGLEG